MINALTVDVEEWYHAHDLGLGREMWGTLEDRVELGTETILEILAENKVRATFFILGSIAAKYPQLVRKISAAGHEIASHGSWHQHLHHQQPDEFRADLLYSKGVLEDITGLGVTTYRAPSWSISPQTLWALEILEQEGFTCDSSVQPFKTPLSGFAGAPVAPFHPIINGHQLRLIEFPPTVTEVGGIRIPFAGGFYLRLLPSWFVTAALNNVNRQRPGMVYLHPWETDSGQPRRSKPMFARLTHYYNLKTTAKKLAKLLAGFRFAPLGELLQNREFSGYHLS